MKSRLKLKVFLNVSLSALLMSSEAARANGQSGAELLEGPKWEVLGAITGFHSAIHKKSGLEARLLEADGSSSVAHNPVGLYLVVTNNGTSDALERIWRLERSVARVRGVTATLCGIDVRVDVDRLNSDGRTQGTDRKTLRLCFLSADGKLQSIAKVSEIPR